MFLRFKNKKLKKILLFSISSMVLFNKCSWHLSNGFEKYLNEFNHTYINKNFYDTETLNAGYIRENVWETLSTSMPTSKAYSSSVAIGEKIYIIGGLDGSSLNRLDIYNTKTNTWDTSKAQMPTARQRLVSAEVDGKIYAIGGWDGSNYLNKVEMYDPSTNTWTTKASMPTARYGLTASVVNGKIYCIGGYGISGHVNTVEMYDPSTNTWTTKASMPTTRFSLSSGVIDDKIYCAGGSNGSYLNTLEVYDPASNTWTTKASMPTARYGLSVSVSDNKLYCIGGYNGSYLTATEMYDPDTNTWTTKTFMKEARFGFTSVTIGKRIYSLGGLNSSSNPKTIECYVASLTEEEKAQNAVIDAEVSNDFNDINKALDIVNGLPDSDFKNELLERLYLLIPKKSTSMIDVYVVPQNILSMSLSTNNICFEDFDGVEDMDFRNALDLNIESTLPYSLHASLDSEISNSDGSLILDKSILSIKESSSNVYQTFVSIKKPILLKDNIEAGENLHSIDLKLNKNIPYKVDVYKTCIKFEAIQK